MDTPFAAPTAAPLTWHKSACNLCYINCGVELGVSGEGAGRRIVKVRGDGDNPRSQGYLCNKAQAIPSYVHHRDRLTTPLRRRADGSHEPIEWDTAVREIAERLGRVVAQHGGKTMPAAAMPSASCVRWDRAPSSMRCRRRRPATSGSTAT